MMKYQEILQLHGLLGQVRQYFETHPRIKIDETYFEQYESQDTRAYHLNAHKPAHQVALIELGNALDQVVADSLTETQSRTSGSIESAKDPSSEDGSQDPPISSMKTDIRDQFIGEDDREPAKNSLWDTVGADDYDPPEYVKASPEEKQALTKKFADEEDETNSTDSEPQSREQRSITEHFS